MSDWDYFCSTSSTDPTDPEQFDNWLSSQEARQDLCSDERLVLRTRELLREFAEPRCPRCSGTGYLGRYRWNCWGRCFLCLPDDKWASAMRLRGS